MSSDVKTLTEPMRPGKLKLCVMPTIRQYFFQKFFDAMLFFS